MTGQQREVSEALLSLLGHSVRLCLEGQQSTSTDLHSELKD